MSLLVVCAGDFDYEAYGEGYARRRRTDPRIAAHILAASGLATGEWDRHYGHLRTQQEFVGSLRLVTAVSDSRLDG